MTARYEFLISGSALPSLSLPFSVERELPRTDMGMKAVFPRSAGREGAEQPALKDAEVAGVEFAGSYGSIQVVVVLGTDRRDG